MVQRVRHTLRWVHTVAMAVWLCLCCCGVQSVLASGLHAALGDGRPVLPPCCAADLAERLAEEGLPAAPVGPSDAPDDDAPRHRCQCRGLIQTTVVPERPTPDFDTVGVAILWPTFGEELAALALAERGAVHAAAVTPVRPPTTLLRLHCALTI